MDCSLPGSSVHGILQARILEWVAISSSRGSSRLGSNLSLLHCRWILYLLKKLHTHGRKFIAIIWPKVINQVVGKLEHFAVICEKAYNNLLKLSEVLVTQLCPTFCNMEFFRQEYWSGSPFPSLGDLPDQGSNSGLLPCRQFPYRLSQQGSPFNLLIYP